MLGQMGLPASMGGLAQLEHTTIKEIALEQNGDYVIYMQLGFLSSQLPGGKQWIKLDVSKLGKAAGLDLGKLMSGTQFQPSDLLGMLDERGREDPEARPGHGRRRRDDALPRHDRPGQGAPVEGADEPAAQRHHRADEDCHLGSLDRQGRPRPPRQDLLQRPARRHAHADGHDDEPLRLRRPRQRSPRRRAARCSTPRSSPSRASAPSTSRRTVFELSGSGTLHAPCSAAGIASRRSSGSGSTCSTATAS